MLECACFPESCLICWCRLDAYPAHLPQGLLVLIAVGGPDAETGVLVHHGHLVDHDELLLGVDVSLLLE